MTPASAGVAIDIERNGLIHREPKSRLASDVAASEVGRVPWSDLQAERTRDRLAWIYSETLSTGVPTMTLAGGSELIIS